MMIPGVKPIHRYKIIVRPNMREFAVLDMKTAERVSIYLPRDKAEEKVRELTDKAVSEEDLESFARECFAIADEWEEDLAMLVFTKDYLNNPAVKKVIRELNQK